MPKNKPVIIIGWPTIAQLAMGLSVDLKDACLIPDDLLHNTARAIQSGEFNACECNKPRRVKPLHYTCGTCDRTIPYLKTKEIHNA